MTDFQMKLSNKIFQASDESQSKHWALKLTSYPHHVFFEVMNGFVGEEKNLFLTSYLFLHEFKRKNSGRVRIAILHYHTELNGPRKFGDMQNIESYGKLTALTKKEQNFLGWEITRETVIQLAPFNALEDYHLNYIDSCDYFYQCNEKGHCRSFDRE